MFIRGPRELGIFVSDKRRKNNLTQAQIADKVGLRQKTVSAFENHSESCKLETVFKLLSAYDLELHIEVKGDDQNKKIPWSEEW